MVLHVAALSVPVSTWIICLYSLSFTDLLVICLAGSACCCFICSSKNTDHLFVFFVDHGAPGLIGFPNKTVGS